MSDHRIVIALFFKKMHAIYQRNINFSIAKAKQLSGAMASLEDTAGSFMDLKTGRITSKKAKKEKSAEDLALGEVKKLNAKFPSVNMF